MQSLLLEDSFEDVFRWPTGQGLQESCCGAVEDTAEKTQMSSQPNTGSKKRTAQ